jgi:hypothetical protein
VALPIATTLAPPAATVTTTGTLALTLIITILSTITTLGGTPAPVLIPALGLAILSPAALARTATTAAAVISPIPITSLHLGTGAGRPNTGPKTGLGLLQTKHRSRGLNQHLHLKFVFSHTEPIQGSFFCFI